MAIDKILEYLFIFLFAGGAYYFDQKRKKKDAKKEIDAEVLALKQINQKLLSALEGKADKEIFDRKLLLTSINVIRSVKHICSDIKARSGAHRVDYWYLHNGVITATNLHVIKASMLVEDTNGSVTITASQNIPVAHFYRNIMKMVDNPDTDFIHTFESEIKDELSSLIMVFGVKSFYAFKTYDEAGYFEGMVTVGFQEERYSMPPNVLSIVKLRVSSVTATIREQLKLAHEQFENKESFSNE